MGYGIMRITKIRTYGAIKKLADHHERTPGYKAKTNPDIDEKRTGQNYYLVDSRVGADGKPVEMTKRFRDRITAGHTAVTKDGKVKKIRDDAVLALDCLCTLTPGALEQKYHRAYFKSWVGWLEKELGGRANVISVVVHEDESNPHAHALVAPIAGNHLSAKEFLGGSRKRIRELQDSFYNDVSRLYGLDRGEVKPLDKDHPRRAHVPTAEFKEQTEKEIARLTGELSKLKGILEALPDERQAEREADEVRKWLREDVEGKAKKDGKYTRIPTEEYDEIVDLIREYCASTVLLSKVNSRLKAAESAAVEAADKGRKYDNLRRVLDNNPDLKALFVARVENMNKSTEKPKDKQKEKDLSNEKGYYL